ncbi:16S rRNA (adenine(1518)-N(6)/adenine(1519)-N(6)) -dimethyltransferase RsmA [Fundidesulfovibrio butyratiphilus]
MSTPFAARPKRSLGQNFLVDPGVARRIVTAVGIEAGDTVVEIGPGRGALTGFLLESAAGRVLALEKDTTLAEELKRLHPDLGVAAVDALAVDWSRLDALPGLRLVSNLPYNVASPLMWDIARTVRTFRRAVFMVQNEVADRVVAAPRTKQYGGLSVWLQSHVRARKLFVVPPGVFRPRPKVDSAVVEFTPLAERDLPANPVGLAALVKGLFSHRRKQLGSILGRSGAPSWIEYLENQGLGPMSRPEELSPIQMMGLLRHLDPEENGKFPYRIEKGKQADKPQSQGSSLDKET